MFTQEYWKKKILILIEDVNPKVYRQLKKQKTLDERAETLADKALETMERLYQNLKQIHLPKNHSPEELTTTEWENQTTALEMTEETIISTIASMTA